MEGTKLATVQCRNCHDCITKFGRKLPGNRVPIVCTPTNASFPFVSIPEGVWAIKYLHGVMIKETIPAGFHFMRPFSEIRYLITKKHTVFDIPVKKCPTKDNVMVQIDIFMMFHIRDAIQFISKLGTEKLTDLLVAAQQESIRNLARSTYHYNIYDLVEFDESEITKDLDRKFHEYGVDITDLMITDVGLPAQMAQRLERETTFHSKNRLQRRRQEFDLLRKNNTEFYEELKLKYKNERLEEKENNTREITYIRKEVDEIHGHTEKMLAEIEAEKEDIKLNITQESEKFETEKLAERDAMLLKMRAKASARRAELEASTFEYIENKKADVEFQVAQNDAEATRIIASAEAKAAPKLRAERAFNVQNKSIDVLKDMSDNAENVVVAGNTGNNLLAQVASSQFQQHFYE